ncbi:MAG: hypothetical protein MOB07_31520 [Acidobacteria bacterium]|nr:hypothetical protein [Acidobacteriota bacterium]
MNDKTRAAMAVLYQHPVLCRGCNALKGWLLHEPVMLLLPTGDCIRYPYRLLCHCGQSVTWNRGHQVQSEDLDSPSEAIENEQDQ